MTKYIGFVLLVVGMTINGSCLGQTNRSVLIADVFINMGIDIGNDSVLVQGGDDVAYLHEFPEEFVQVGFKSYVVSKPFAGWKEWGGAKLDSIGSYRDTLLQEFGVESTYKFLLRFDQHLPMNCKNVVCVDQDYSMDSVYSHMSVLESISVLVPKHITSCYDKDQQVVYSCGAKFVSTLNSSNILQVFIVEAYNDCEGELYRLEVVARSGEKTWYSFRRI